MGNQQNDQRDRQNQQGDRNRSPGQQQQGGTPGIDPEKFPDKQPNRPDIEDDQNDLPEGDNNRVV